MQKIKFFLAFCCLISLGFLSAGDAPAQKRKSKTKKKKSEKLVQLEAVGIGSGGGGFKREPYLTLEPCAKETPEQISELENAPDKNKQLEILLKRIDEKDDWLRACAIYRLGEFGAEANEALPVILKLLHDEKNTEVWAHVSAALWKIPPDRNIRFKRRLELAQSDDVYLRIYGVYTLQYFKPIAGTMEAKDVLNSLIEAARDEDITVRWLAVMGIRRLGFFGINTADAIPVLTELLQNGKINPVHPVNAFVSMGANALPAAPLLFDVLYNPKKYAGEKDENSRSYGLYLSAAMALGNIGKPLVPLLDKEFEKQPFAVLQVLNYITADGTFPIFFKALRHQNPEVRQKAIERLPGLTSIGAVEILPHLLTATKDVNPEVRNAAMSKIGNIARFIEEKSDALREILKKRAVPALIANLANKETACYAALNLRDLGADGEAAIPVLARLVKKGDGNYCAEVALFGFGEKGRKFLTKEQIKSQEESKKADAELFNGDYNKAKPIKPKVEPKPSPSGTKDT